MLPQVVDPVVVEHRLFPIFQSHQLILGADAVFHDKQRKLIPVIEAVQRVAKPLGIDLPAPGGGL